MEKRPTSGRKKNVGKGTASVGKREESAGVHGPVGREDGYAGKQAAQQTNGGESADRGSLLGTLLGDSTGQQSQSSGQQSGGILGGFGSTTGGSGYQQSGSSGGTRGKSSLTKIILIIAVIFIAYLLLKSCTGGSGCSSLLSGLSGMSGYDDSSDIISYSGSSVSNGSLLSGLLSDTYDVSDSSAAMAAYASTSGSSASSSSSSSTALIADTTVSNNARAKRTQIKGNGQDVVTVMVYMCGTDLESKYGMGTNDLNEMLHATLDNDHINLIVETGGTKTWKNNVISSSTNQRYRVTSKGLQVLDNNLGKLNMTSPDTLSDFIKFCKANYPADRYALIFWDHGGGSLTGYGYDQYFSGSMTLDKINKALKDGGCEFDFIGFDACLMATLETAIVTEQYADYLIASEETEPGCGWYYTDWLTALSNNPSISTVELGKLIIDDFNDVCRKNNCGDSTTLSITDLAEFAGTVPEAFGAFCTSVSEMLEGSEYQVVAKARSEAKEFGESSGLNQIDLIHLAKGIASRSASGSDEAQALADALSGCIKYNRTAVSMKNSYGISVYFPYTSFSSVNSAISLYNAIGVDSRYSKAIKSFASLAAGGQIATGQTSSPVSSLLGSYSSSGSSSSSDMLSQLLGSYLGGSSSGSSSSSSGSLLSSLMGSDYSSWFDGRMVLDHSEYYDEHALYEQDMLLTDKAGGKVLSLSDEKWEMVESICLNVFFDDGEGYIDLGMDNVFDYDDDGDLMISFDGTWLTVNGQVVAYYVENVAKEDDGTMVTNGRIPAKLNGEPVYLMVVFEYDPVTDTETDYIAGARYIYVNGETDTVGKGLIEIKDGDRIDFICDYYGYDGSYVDSYLLGDTLTVRGELTVEYLELENVNCVITYCLTDIYNNEFWTESVKF